jgi:hypothetical protein
MERRVFSIAQFACNSAQTTRLLSGPTARPGLVSSRHTREVFSSIGMVFSYGLFGHSGRQKQSSSAEGQSAYEIVKSVIYVGRSGNHHRNVDRQEQGKSHDTETCCRQSWLEVHCQTCPRQDKNGTRKVSPKCAPRNPRWRKFIEINGGQEIGMQEMLHTEKDGGQGNKNSRNDYERTRTLGLPLVGLSSR